MSPKNFREITKLWIKKFYENEDAKKHFITLPQISDVLSLAIALHLKKEFGNSQLIIIELGAGGGELTKSIVKFADEISLNIKKVILVEQSKRRRKDIKEKLRTMNKPYVEVKKDINQALETIEETSITTKKVIISNEFFDSLPFSVVKYDGSRLTELFIIGNFPYDFSLEFLPPEEKTFLFFKEYMKDEIEKCVSKFETSFIFEICRDFEMFTLMKSFDSIIISDYGYPCICNRLPSGSVIMHSNFKAEKLDFSSLERAKELISKGFGKKDISFFIDFEVIEKIAYKMNFSFSIKPLSRFVFQSLDEFRDYTEKILFTGESKVNNIISFSDIMSGWGNFFIAELSRIEKIPK